MDVHRNGFTPDNALSLVKEYDVVIDASDNAPTRYLISDACCVSEKPLISGAAIGTDGQLNVYCYNDGEGAILALYFKTYMSSEHLCIGYRMLTLFLDASNRRRIGDSRDT